MNSAPPSPGFAHFLGQTDTMGLVVLALLLLMSLATWYVILTRLAQGWRRGRRSRDFLARFQDRPAPLAGEAMEPFGRVAVTAFRSWARRAGTSPGATVHDTPAEWLARALRRAVRDEAARLEHGLALLASVAAAAPFVGLFGTVWGIYHALLAIGASGRAGLDQVAGPVGEALVMTALGLSVAIPAVLAYNAFQRGNRVLLAELDGFAHDLYDHLAGGGAVPAGAAGRAD